VNEELFLSGALLREARKSALHFFSAELISRPEL